VPFCGHATIATGYVLGEQNGKGTYKLYLNKESIEVSVKKTITDALNVSFKSPLTFSEPAPSEYAKSILEAFNLTHEDVNSDFPVRFASAGAKHLIIVLEKREKLSGMSLSMSKI